MKDQKNMYPRKTRHEKSRRTIYELLIYKFSYKMGVLNEKRCKKNPKLNSFICISEDGTQMKVLLRWKNGNGIAFPAFQISEYSKKSKNK